MSWFETIGSTPSLGHNRSEPETKTWRNPLTSEPCQDEAKTWQTSLTSKPCEVCSVIFVDLPLGTGFSYAKDVTTHRSDWKLVHHTHQFLRKWLIHHPEFHSNEFYMGGDSYSGIPVPAIVQEISNGNPLTTHKENNHLVPFAHGMGLISDELYAHADDYISNRWANYESVRKSLHIREGTIGKWQRCYKTDFEYQIFNSFDFHANLSAKGYRSLIYSGDHDGDVPLLSTQAWIRALNYSIVDDWRPWLHQGQVAG
ncbi:hypothetical protein Fmac_029038 [Flemingia macrophylla]|uniref:Serine carboxypeptidase n=1 Tax=Flemingia macrophylla TaxID=520843 RepID=A0ABD1L986_9FABA